MMRKFRLSLGVALFSLLALPAAAQEVGCELHVWPSEGMQTVRQRGFESVPAAGAIPALIKREREKAAERADARALGALAASDVPEPLATVRQVELLKGLALPEMLGLNGYAPVVHDVPLESRTIRTSKGRYAESGAPCYADLVIDDVFYSREFGHGRKLKTFFRFRDFGSGAAVRRSYGTWVETKLLIFSIDPLNQSAPALEEIVSAYRTNATAFSDLLRKRP